MRFFSKCLNPFKIQTIFKLDLFFKFIIQNPEGFGSWTKKKICSIEIYLPPCKIWEFLDLRKMVFSIFDVESFEIN
jgi:hypothetical protein